MPQVPGGHGSGGGSEARVRVRLRRRDLRQRRRPQGVHQDGRHAEARRGPNVTKLFCPKFTKLFQSSLMFVGKARTPALECWCFNQVGWYLLANIRRRLAWDKHSSLLRKFVNYGEKGFITLCQDRDGVAESRVDLSGRHERRQHGQPR